MQTSSVDILSLTARLEVTLCKQAECRVQASHSRHCGESRSLRKGGDDAGGKARGGDPGTKADDGVATLQHAMAGQSRSYEIYQQASPTFLLVKHVLCDVAGAGQMV